MGSTKHDEPPALEITGFSSSPDGIACLHDANPSTVVPQFVGKLLRLGDRVSILGAAFLFRRDSPGRRPVDMLYAPIANARAPQRSSRGEWLIRADLPDCREQPSFLYLEGDSIVRYFYTAGDGASSLYDALRCSPYASLADLRFAWRLRNLELQGTPTSAIEAAKAERAFNLLADADLRRCYDDLRSDPNAPPLFPYGGFGTILVEGSLSADCATFFGSRIVAYRPSIEQRRISVRLRRCEFLEDRINFHDPRRRCLASIDRNLLPELRWDLTWNHWRHWLRSRIELEGAFAKTAGPASTNAARSGGNWLVAVPSRTAVRAPEDLNADVEMARSTQELLGEHADLVVKVRKIIEREPIEHCEVQRWLDECGASSRLKPEHIIWKNAFEPYYFSQLKDRALTWFLFRNEFLFFLERVVVSEVPEPGRATYFFTRPDSEADFLARYAITTRDDVRRNRDGCATGLGYVGRVIRGRRKERWLSSVIRFLDASGHAAT